MKNNQTTTEGKHDEIVDNVLKVAGLDWFQIEVVKQLLAAVKKAVLSDLLEKSLIGDGKYDTEILFNEIIKLLAHSQEDREGKENK